MREKGEGRGRDRMIPQPHDVDVKALLRLDVLYDILLPVLK